MSETPLLPSYEEVSTALKNADSTFDASQTQGFFCGLICITPAEPNDKIWKELILGEKKPKKSVEILEQLYETSYHLLSEFSFEFSLVLPEDSKDINDRTEALGLWCQGFLAGLEQNHDIVAERASDEAKEALNDIIEIAQVNFGDLKDSDEDESAYFELVEYVRLSVLMIFQDLRSGKAQEGDDLN